MNLNVAKLPRLIAERRSSAIFGVVIIAMLWSGLAFKYLGDVNTDLQMAERNNQNFAMVFEENVLRSIGEIDKALLYMRRSVETRATVNDFSTIVNTTDILSEIIVQVAIIDANGIMRASNAGPQPAPVLDLSDREHYRTHLNSNEDKLFISKPVIGRVSGLWSVQVTRRFVDQNKKLGGVVVASLDPNHLTHFYDKIDFGLSASIALIGADGVVRSSGGRAGGFVLGQDLAGTRIGSEIHAGAKATFDDIDPSTNETRLVTIRNVRGHPLFVAVSVNKSEIFKASWNAFRWEVLAGIILTLVMLAAMERIFMSEERASQKAKHLSFTLEHMGQGIMLVTKDLQIPIINRKCAELLNSYRIHRDPPQLRPPDCLPGQFKRRARVSAGNSADSLNETAAASSSSSSSLRSICERRMPNGQVIEVRSGQLPDGSFVHTITDTTACESFHQGTLEVDDFIDARAQQVRLPRWSLPVFDCP